MHHSSKTLQLVQKNYGVFFCSVVEKHAVNAIPHFSKSQLGMQMIDYYIHSLSMDQYAAIFHERTVKTPRRFII